ncbi:DUF1870 family protein [Serratia sp. (in: enterobacteria)]|uniref:Aca2/YdiL-like domain-containing protein n=1 Tax=Serratia sp. (in: enterobacteria) TaxID=616 RepID=UPI003989AEF2
MNNTEFEAARRLLFFSLAEAATIVAGVSEQTWRRWEAGAKPIPDDVTETMSFLMKWRDNAILGAVQQLEESPDPQNTEIFLVWYQTMDDFGTLPDREPIFWRPHQSVCSALLAAFPGQINLVKFSPPEYSKWLGDQQDSETLRSAWATGI